MVESEEGNLFNANLMTGYFLYNKAKRRRSTLYITKRNFQKKAYYQAIQNYKTKFKIIKFQRV